jgi:hypothetical protein
VRFWVDAWDPAYGSTDELDLSTAEVDPYVETRRWEPVPAAGADTVAVHFVDGVRRVDAHVWIDGPDGVVGGLAASYAAGVVSCRAGEARADVVEVRRGLFTPAAGALPVTLPMTRYEVHEARSADGPDLSSALQIAMAATEVDCALRARTDADDLIVVDGPLLRHRQLARALGLIKTEAKSYLPPDLDAVVPQLGPGERTPVFRIEQPWSRCSWYLRLPCRPGAPRTGVVRVESPDLDLDDVVALAALSQAVLPRYASAEHKDSRAPQNLYPIAGLERLLRRRLGDPLLLARQLRTAAA